MKHYRTLIVSALVAFSALSTLAQTSKIASVAIGTASTAGGTANGVAVVTERIGTPLNQPGSVGNTLAGLQYVPGQIPLDGSPASIAFFTLSGATIPGGAGNPATAFTSYGTLTSPTAVTTYGDAASKLTADTYSALTFAEADLGAGSRDFYTIHHRPGTDYLAQIVPGTGVATLIRDLKPMSWTGPTAGGPANTGTTGYFGLAWATGILSAGAPYVDQSLYYLRSDASVPSHTKFGVMIPALTGGSSDTLDLTTAVGSFGVGGYTALAFSPIALGNYGANQFYYLRQDTGTGGTGNTILGRLNPSLVAGVRTISDIANLGGVFTTLNFAADATGPAGAWGTNQLYLTGALVAGAQSISFEAVPDHNVGDVFILTPTASSGLDLDVTVVSGPATIQTGGTSGATPLSLRTFTVTTTGSGIVTLQARQAGRTSPLPAYTANMLQQSFNVRGVPFITSATSAPATTGAAFTYTIISTGSPTSYAASPLPVGLVLNSTTGVISGTPTVAGTTLVTLTTTNATGTSSPTTLTITVGSATAVPVITSANSVPATSGSPFSYTIAATGSATSYTASPLPPGLVLNGTTGVISGTPTATGTTYVTLTATNALGTSTTTLTVTVGSATAAPIITSPVSAPGTVGTPFPTYVITATGVPASYTATGLPPGLTVNALTGAISGTPTTSGTWTVTVTATNASGTSTTTLVISVASSPGGSSRLVNFSARAISGPGDQTLIVGFVIAGNGKNLLVRGIGPTLSSFGVTNALADPMLTLYDLTGAIATNDDWQVTASGQASGALIASTAAQVGAFPLVSGSKDSALLVMVNNGVHTTSMVRPNSTTGVALTEIYDIDPPSGTRLVNVSARMNVSAGEGTLIAGFVISGTVPKTVLIRAVGPTLSGFAVTGVLADPMITVYSGNTALATNDNWEAGINTSAQISSASAQVGAFPLVAGSKDAALLVTLAPGAYSVQVTGIGNPAGIALIEVYDTQ